MQFPALELHLLFEVLLVDLTCAAVVVLRSCLVVALSCLGVVIHACVALRNIFGGAELIEPNSLVVNFFAHFKDVRSLIVLTLLHLQLRLV
jgi:hypothetical protein